MTDNARRFIKKWIVTYRDWEDEERVASHLGRDIHFDSKAEADEWIRTCMDREAYGHALEMTVREGSGVPWVRPKKREPVDCLPCPFCGFEPPPQLYVVRCERCLFALSVEEWNKRA